MVVFRSGKLCYCNCSCNTCTRRSVGEYFSCGRVSPAISISYFSNFKLTLLRAAKTGCIATTHAQVNQGQMPWHFACQVVKEDLVTIDAISCKNYPTRGMCCDLSWPLNMSMQEMQRFTNRVMKPCRVVCRPRIKDSLVLGLECSRHWPSASSLCNSRRLICISTQFLWSTGLVGGTQRLRTVRTFLRLRGSYSKLRLQQLQFKISRMVAGVKVGSLAALQRQWVSLPQVSASIVMFRIIFEASDDEME